MSDVNSACDNCGQYVDERDSATISRGNLLWCDDKCKQEWLEINRFDHDPDHHDVGGEG